MGRYETGQTALHQLWRTAAAMCKYLVAHSTEKVQIRTRMMKQKLKGITNRRMFYEAEQSKIAKMELESANLNFLKFFQKVNVIYSCDSYWCREDDAVISRLQSYILHLQHLCSFLHANSGRADTVGGVRW